jgi:hypothetical protein
VLAKPGTLTAHQKFDAEIYALTKEEGGRHTPFMANYSPQFFFRTANITGTVHLAADRQMVLPGDNCKVTCELLTPVALNEGMRFAFREGGRCDARERARAHDAHRRARASERSASHRHASRWQPARAVTRRAPVAPPSLCARALARVGLSAPESSPSSTRWLPSRSEARCDQ